MDVLAVVGGTKFSTRELISWVYSLPLETKIVTGNGKGAEQMVRRLLERRGIAPLVPPLQPDWFTKPTEGQVGQILDASTGDVVVVGAGSRVNKVKSWHKRARWARELVSVGQ